MFLVVIYFRQYVIKVLFEMCKNYSHDDFEFFKFINCATVYSETLLATMTGGYFKNKI